ncbi:hypothetical protein [Olleya sp. Bg11-27]|uniref:DUF6630 family protein n=1 Tax=Olleya sp. Bg11-27 TaxID=2058135 RepID=UPI000C309510|nr:hypothetical protein [Olleya sp. Bg11-27]AUC75674.1 hypothetical protein CW732_08305 [Olleya sp. Bg11-27]
MNKTRFYFITLFVFLVLASYVWLNFEFKVYLWWFIPFFWWLIIKEVVTGKKWFEKKDNTLKEVNPFIPQYIEEEIDVSKNEKEGLKGIVKLCSPLKTQNKLLSFIDTNKFIELPWYELNEYAMENKIDLFIHLDWKESVSELHYWIDTVVKSLLEKEIELPNYKRFEANYLINTDWDAFKVYNEAIKKHNLQISLLETGGDEYVLVIHFTENLEKVGNAIAMLGYKHRYYK